MCPSSIYFGPKFIYGGTTVRPKDILFEYMGPCCGPKPYNIVGDDPFIRG